ncbi:hypothetical protein [Nocardia iowensis]|uniref:GerMN domain-containing protein n=1 Tax=Nocardia iowensis TaxID=204891 RepID=A0ABX8RG21_NOCIO|nr:hypothetical protein [Nocardia iowensis]QXN88563.1 hypothetical protein KV110_23510 [Nocardia iowensis]
MNTRIVLPLIAAVLALAGCGVSPSGVRVGGQAPTGVAPGVYLYFLDAHNELRPELYRTQRLGTVASALDLLLRAGPPTALRSDLPVIQSSGPVVDMANSTMTIRVPLDRDEIGPRGVDQIICTALGVTRQSGDDRTTEVVVSFTIAPATEPRRCPQH